MCIRDRVNQQIAAELTKIAYVDPNPYAPPTSPEPQEYVWIDDEAPAGANLQGDSPWEFITKEQGPVFSGTKATKRKAAATSQHFFIGATKTLKVGAGDKLFAYVYLDPADLPKTVMLQWNDGAWEHRACLLYTSDAAD